MSANGSVGEFPSETSKIFDLAQSSNLTKFSCGPQKRSPEPGTYPYYILLYVFPIWFIIGTVGNATIIVVLKRIKDKSTNYFSHKSTSYLSAMALADFLFFIPMLVISLNTYDSLATSQHFLYFSYHSMTSMLAMANWFSTASNWFIVCIAMERLQVIRNPLSTDKHICKSSVVKTLIVTIFVLSALVQIPKFFGYQVIETVHQNVTVYCYIFRLSYMNNFMIRFTRAVTPFITVIIPLVMLTVLNFCLVYYVRRSRLDVKKMGYVNPNQRGSSEYKVTKLILAIVVTFFILNTPSAIVVGLPAIVNDPAFDLALKGLPAHTTNNMVVLSKVINFFLYYCCSSKFRKHFQSLWQNFRKKISWSSPMSSTRSTIINSFHRLSK